MREWKGFTSLDPKHMADTLDRHMKEFSAAIKRIQRGAGPAANAATLTLPPAEAGLTADGVQVTPIGRLAKIDLSNPSNGATAVLYANASPGVYRMTFVVYATNIPTTSDLTVAAEFGPLLDIAYAASAMPMVVGPYLYGTTTFVTTDTADISYEITYTNTLDCDLWLVLEAL